MTRAPRSRRLAAEPVVDLAEVDAAVERGHAFLEAHPEIVGNLSRDPALADRLDAQARAHHARRRGRPSLSPADEPSARITVRLTAEDKATAEAIAEEQGMPLAQWARAELIKAISGPRAS